MRTASFLSALTLALLLAGCGKEAPAPATNQSEGPPVAQPALAAWQQGDESSAVSVFVQTDWTRRPLFPPDSPLSLSEAEFAKLSNAKRQTESEKMLSQVEAVKRLGVAVAQAGRNAAAQGDTAQAQKHFNALKQFGAAADSPDSLRLLQLVGQAQKKTADAELAKIGK